MFGNRGDLPAARLKAKATRAIRKGLPPKKSLQPNAETSTGDMMKTPAAPSPLPNNAPMMKKVQKSRTFRFRGSMKYGGPIKHTGLYLMHAGEHVRSPFKKGK